MTGTKEATLIYCPFENCDCVCIQPNHGGVIGQEKHDKSLFHGIILRLTNFI